MEPLGGAEMGAPDGRALARAWERVRLLLGLLALASMIVTAIALTAGLSAPLVVTMEAAALGLILALALAATRMRRAAEAATEHLSLFRQAIERGPMSMVLTDRDGTIEYVNPQFCRASGYAPQELLGGNPRMFKSGQTPPEVYQALWTALNEGREWSGEILNRRKSGELFWEHEAILPVRDAHGDVRKFIAVKEDVTRLKYLEQALNLARHHADKAARGQSDFLSSMSHELRTPLNAILGYAELISSQPFGPLGHPRYREYLDAVQQSARLLLGLIADMLELSRIEHGKVVLDEETVSPADLINPVAAMIAERAARGELRLDVVCEPHLPDLLVDAQRMKQVLLALLGNAVKFTPPGGRVVLGAKNDDDGGVTFHISDNGPGIAAADIPRVLEPFQMTGSNPYVRREEGAGLGLPLSRQIVELHGGRLSIASAPGAGTTVTVTVPVERCRATPTRLAQVSRA